MMAQAALRLTTGATLRGREVTCGALVVGDHGRDERQRAIAEAADRAGERLIVSSDPEHARRVLSDPYVSPPRCIFVDAMEPGLEGFVSWLRGEARLFAVPVIVQVATPSDPAFCEAHALGADDVIVAGDRGAITRRLANLADFDPAARPPVTQGRAVIAHADSRRRRVLGRILRQAGFEVSFAGGGAELVRAAEGDAPALVVADHGLRPEGGLSALDALRAGAAAHTPVVVLGPRAELEPLRRQYESRGRVALGPADGPADNLLFLANELMRPDVQNVRASRRVLFGTLSAFRRAGDMSSVHGLTYNISREGLYVRTLDPPPAGAQLWFEMRPPFRGEAIHLRGRVMWCRGLRSGGGAAPPGFGMRIDEDASPAEDLAAYREAYDALRENELLSRH